jgi:hypothetical protein
MNTKDLLPRLAFLFGLAFLAYLFGFTTAHFRLFPHDFLVTAFEQGKQAQQQPDIQAHHIHPARHDFAGVVRREGTAVEPGVVLVSSYFPDFAWGPGLRLLDRDGNVLHRWNTDPLRLWPTSPHRDDLGAFFHTRTNYVHGTHLFANGDVMCNIEYQGLVRLNAGGDVVWRLDHRTHHSIAENERGNFWVSSARWRSDPADVARRFPGLLPPVSEETALEVAADGTVVREVSVLESIFAHPELRRAIWMLWPSRTGDITHLNDVEELPSAMAAAYPSLRAGDLLVSCKHLDLVFVMDPKTLAVRWWRIGPFSKQHDPDFLGDGTISVYDNNTDGSLDGAFLGGSRLLRIGIERDLVATIYPRDAVGERRFYSEVGGKAQRLANGNWFLIEPRAGRVFEVDPAGRTVWEWGHERHGKDQMCEVLEGTLYPFETAQVQGWSRR